MSKYTTEVRFICESLYGATESTDYMGIKDVISTARGRIFDFQYPIYDESYRSVLESKILKHFYTREIGFETVALWKHWLDMRMNEIMPYYNQLYKSTLLEFNPLYDVDYNREYSKKNDEQSEYTKSEQTEEERSEIENKTINDTNEKTIDETGIITNEENNSKTSDETTKTLSTQSSSTDVNNSYNESVNESTDITRNKWDAYSDTPQGSLQNVENNEYLTNARKINESENSDGNKTTTGSGESHTDFEGNDSTNVTANITETNDKTGSESSKKDVTENGVRDITQNGTRNNNFNSSFSGNNKGDINSTEDYLEHVYGKQGSSDYSTMIMKYRETFINIDMMVINDLNDLFMNLW